MTEAPEVIAGKSNNGPTDPFTETVDARAARITARGTLRLRAAELLAATVRQLQRSGASCVVLDLSLATGTERAALALLAGLRREMAEAGSRLVVRTTLGPGVPAESGASSPQGSAADRKK